MHAHRATSGHSAYTEAENLSVLPIKKALRLAANSPGRVVLSYIFS